MLTYILFIIGFALLLKGAEWLIDGSTALAKRLGVSTLVVGLTVVALGTSMPEFIVNITSAVKGVTDVALGNIIGSNVFNLMGILGFSAILVPIVVSKRVIYKDVHWSLLAALLVLVMISIGKLSRIDGILLLLIYALYVYMLWKGVQKEKPKVEVHRHSSIMIATLIIGGIISLFAGGRWVVNGAVEIAKALGISEYFISFTIVAIGTSLPELVTSIVSLRKDHDILVGNIIGSNIVNILFILAISAIIRPIPYEAGVNRDLILLMIATILTFLFVLKKHRLERWHGIVFVGAYIIYVTVKMLI